ncbi:tripartite motif-containing protein 3 [Octopus bimaculoides]|uniref:RING-type domain-containing protein n=1 Tax=Octopus bimaculoides TaxID=37653 RepID=A0A0L8GZF1_OCTBM|nr:tripartite motif-containing protein 3 [Octopus bimaculoides]|eukprot:XP_014776769.1 PREDICTED: tripartite motif-containing protein 3-like [Octopus bimaculoides]
MSSDLEQKIAADITCSICLEIFSRPLTLVPCLHSYCKHCLELYVKNFADNNGCFPCPECRIQITLPSEGIEGLTHNHTLQSILDNWFLHNKGKAEIEQQVPEAEVNKNEYVDLSSYTVVDMDEESQLEKNEHTKKQQHFNTDTNKTSQISSNEPTQLPNLPNLHACNASLPPLPCIPSAPFPQYNLYPYIRDNDSNDLNYQTYSPQKDFCTEGLLVKFGQYSRHVNEFQKPYGIAINRAGHICVSDLKGGRILIFSPTGIFLNKLLPSCDIYDVAILPNQNILTSVAKADKAILHIYNMNSHLISQYTGLHFQYARPSGVAVNKYGYAIVTSLENDCVYVFTEEGKLSLKFGWKGSGNDHFNRPYFVTTNDKLQIIVSDCGNNCIKVFSSDGKFKCKYGKKGKDKGMLFKPMGVCTDRNNNIIVADYGNYRVQAFSPKGRSLGFPVYDTFRIGKDVSPINVAINRHNNVVVLLTGEKFAEVRVYEWNPEV